MSYFSSGNNPLAFPTYGQAPLPQRSLTGLTGIQQPPPPQLGQIQEHGHPHGDPSSAAGLGHGQQQVQHQGGESIGLRAHQVQGPGMGGVPGQQGNSSAQAQTAKDTHHTERKERKNRPGQKFGAKKKSWVWTWFIQDSQDPNVAACDYCGKIITRLPSDKGSPKKLSEHLKTHKLTKDSINDSRPIPIDGSGISYASNGMPLKYASNFQTSPQQMALQHAKTPIMGPMKGQLGEDIDVDSRKKARYSKTKRKAPEGSLDTSLESYDMQSNRRFLSSEFDNSPYSSMKFHKHLMKFLTENKLSINVIKSHSFQQLIYDLRSDSVTELLELTSLYSSLLEVSIFDSNDKTSSNDHNPDSSSSMPPANQSNVVNAMRQGVDSKIHNPNSI
ncbi:Piso0_002460 [Millerozyma farinosa CBS 7064]|uniref:Piso0_002460 protein n=1 Tax=Pichia sorbitophila (strain ATCC MYA-4447 / BCRC 22081 / CBS 7064 / NBRC 10061 / NRRL Y-12695) TaxID=559304 RepID=G8YCN7_PICSO|nr:Piso0_002460 [Millerozyma farinosa CBS 7064]